MKTRFNASVPGSSVNAASTMSRCAIRAQASSVSISPTMSTRSGLPARFIAMADRTVAHRLGHADIAAEHQR